MKKKTMDPRRFTDLNDQRNLDVHMDWNSHTNNEEIEAYSTSVTLDEELRTPIGSDVDEVESLPICEENSKDFSLGRTYSYIKEIKKEIELYSLKEGFDITFVQSDTKRLTARCADGCSWRLHASKIKDEETYQIKTLVNSHNCARVVENQNARAKNLATHYLDRFRSQSMWAIPSIIETVRKDLTVNITHDIAKRARSIARTLNEGHGDEEYKLVWSYASEIYRSNPGSTLAVHTYDTGSTLMICQRVYMCMSASKAGLLQHGRPVICLDGCHLKGSCPGQLLMAVSIDGNDGIYPVAVANVEKETEETWTWFLGILKQDLNMGSDENWTIISDRQKGLRNAVETEFRYAEHRFCLRHMYLNFKSLFRGKKYREAMWKAARAPTQNHFEIEMRKICQLNSEAHAWLRREEPRHWASYAFSSIPKCDIGLNNLSESYNAVLLPARDKPIITMFETIRKDLMARIVKKFEKMAQSTDILCPRIKKKLKDLQISARNWSAQLAGDARFEVSNSYEQYKVDMNMGVCECTRWELTGIPCVHSIPCINKMRVELERYVHPYYHRVTYMQMYSHFIQPMNGPQMWPAMTALMPPRRHRQPGRPKKTRVRDVDEPSSSKVSKKNSKMTCGICRQQGHNIRTCPHRGSTSDAAAADTFMGFNEFEGTQESATRGRGRN